MFNRCCFSFLKTLVLVACLTLLAACSASRLAYNNLDWLINWKVSDYISLTGDQKRWLRARTQEQLAWHCSVELPRYLPLLDHLETSLRDEQLDSSMLSQGLPRIETAVDRLLTEIAPTVSGLLRQLDARQVEELKANLQKKHAELVEKYVEPDLTTQHRERVDRAQERLEDWLGPLDKQQYARLSDWADQLQGHSSIWLDNRLAWQNAFLTAVENRGKPEFDQQITELLIEREQFWIDRYGRIADINQEQGARLLADLMNLASDKQKQHLTKRFSTLRADMEALQCTKA
ncbi:DUF6279 family lipoprotein [Halopseudomonas salina]|uniref:Lipoprotein n=1 Tax=Halopseudomonas salina TaxID=1323744 RepID=A0ABQ1P1D9_9GAMM|nr:DUF6279 family lipoprotein [Halopseudomonas salina]GGC88413.1 lipoprotein [Halopseudomonas salina]